MRMKSSTKNFNNVNCKQSQAHAATLFEARPIGQSRITREQSDVLRHQGSRIRLQKSNKLVHKLTREVSKASQSSLASETGSIRAFRRG